VKLIEGSIEGRRKDDLISAQRKYRKQKAVQFAGNQRKRKL